MKREMYIAKVYFCITVAEDEENPEKEVKKVIDIMASSSEACDGCEIAYIGHE